MAIHVAIGVTDAAAQRQRAGTHHGEAEGLIVSSRG